MGGDCCAPDSLPAAQHMLNDLHLNTGENEGADTAKAASPKSHQEHAKELEDFIRKRIDLFEQYKAREDAQARAFSAYYVPEAAHQKTMCLAVMCWKACTVSSQS